MRIEGLRSEREGNKARVAATVCWEDCDRATQEVYFEVDEAFADGLSCNPHAFLVGCIIPAIHYGEERVFVDAEICPELRDGLVTAMNWLRHWFYGPDRELVRIEAGTKSGFPTPRTPERAGVFFSGGIDSFATLRANRLNYPLGHPDSIKDGLIVFGLELDDHQAFEHVLNSFSAIAQDLGIMLIPVYTNLYLNYRQEDAASHFRFWQNEFQGAALAAVAHAFARRLSVVSIASSHDLFHLRPYGTHPILDPNYGSSDLRIRHEGIALSRFDKTKLVADWDVALQHLRVCNHFERYQSGWLNCGRCEKCVRTMLALLALGVLGQTRAFPIDDVSADLVRSKVRVMYDMVYFYRDLIAPLAEKGRPDLVHAVEHVIAESRDRQFGWKAKAVQLDRQYLNGRLAGFKRFILHQR
jgi:hypothetical protein